MTDQRYENVLRSVGDLRRTFPERLPTVGLVTGSGFGDLANLVDDPQSTSFEDIFGFPPCGVDGHAGRVLVGLVDGVQVVVLQGRAHLYEGHDVNAVVHPVRTLAAWGVKTLILTNAAGSLHSCISPGSLLLIEDHINQMGTNPFIGPPDERLGPRHPSPTDVYDPELIKLFADKLRTLGLSQIRGIYIGALGPLFETPAEGWRDAKVGTAAGMSTVNEALAAWAMGVRVIALSGISNWVNGCAPSDVKSVTRHDNILNIVKDVASSVVPALREFIIEVGKLQKT